MNQFRLHYAKFYTISVNEQIMTLDIDISMCVMYDEQGCV